MSAKHFERVCHIEKLLLLENLIIDVDLLRSACLYGIPDQLRPICWRLLLNYLPRQRERWAEVLKEQREQYEQLVENLIVGGGDCEQAAKEATLSHEDHPLADPLTVGAKSPTSKNTEENESSLRTSGIGWADFFRDNEVLSQIDKDVRRLRPEIEFFQRPNPHPHSNAATILASRLRTSTLGTLTSAGVHEAKLGGQSFISSAADHSKGHSRNTSQGSIPSTHSPAHAPDTDERVESGVEKHWEVVERILFIFSKLNPGVRYVQGMNELMGPLYYVYASDPDVEWAEWAEADAFYSFQNLMSEVRDNFIKKLDHSHCGIEATLFNFHQLLRQHDPSLHAHIVEKLGVLPEFYAFRWISLLLSQEFSLPDVIALWDTLFCCFGANGPQMPQMMQMCQCFCLAMLLEVRSELMAADFVQCLRLLQYYPTDRMNMMDNLVSAAVKLAMKEAKHSKNPSTPVGGKRESCAEKDLSSSGEAAATNQSGVPTNRITNSPIPVFKREWGDRAAQRLKSGFASLISTTKQRVGNGSYRKRAS